MVVDIVQYLGVFLVLLLAFVGLIEFFTLIVYASGQTGCVCVLPLSDMTVEDIEYRIRACVRTERTLGRSFSPILLADTAEEELLHIAYRMAKEYKIPICKPEQLLQGVRAPDTVWTK